MVDPNLIARLAGTASRGADDFADPLVDAIKKVMTVKRFQQSLPADTPSPAPRTVSEVVEPTPGVASLVDPTRRSQGPNVVTSEAMGLGTVPDPALGNQNKAQFLVNLNPADPEHQRQLGNILRQANTKATRLSRVGGRQTSVVGTDLEGVGRADLDARLSASTREALRDAEVDRIPSNSGPTAMRGKATVDEHPERTFMQQSEANIHSARSPKAEFSTRNAVTDFKQQKNAMIARSMGQDSVEIGEARGRVGMGEIDAASQRIEDFIRLEQEAFNQLRKSRGIKGTVTPSFRGDFEIFAVRRMITGEARHVTPDGKEIAPPPGYAENLKTIYQSRGEPEIAAAIKTTGQPDPADAARIPEPNRPSVDVDDPQSIAEGLFNYADEPVDELDLIGNQAHHNPYVQDRPSGRLTDEGMQKEVDYLQRELLGSDWKKRRLEEVLNGDLKGGEAVSPEEADLLRSGLAGSGDVFSQGEQLLVELRSLLRTNIPNKGRVVQVVQMLEQGIAEGDFEEVLNAINRYDSIVNGA